MKKYLSLFLCSLALMGCNKKSDKQNQMNDTIASPKTVTPAKELSPQPMVPKKEIPVLCYHNIKNIHATDSQFRRTYTVTPSAFALQMKTLSEHGFHTILPDQLYDYLENNTPLPSKPILITFDDTREEQFRIGATELEKYGFKGVFFIMTVSIGRPNYMTKEQIKTLSDNGHTIAAHTWDHHRVDKYTVTDWHIQLDKPQKQLEAITNKPIRYFAYPFGIWSKDAITELKNRDYKLAFILATKKDSAQSRYTIRRIIVPSYEPNTLLKSIENNFNN